MMGDDDLEVRSTDDPDVDVGSTGSDDVLDVGPVHRLVVHTPGFVARARSRLPSWIGRPPRVPTFALLIGIVVGLGIAILITGGHSTTVVTTQTTQTTQPTTSNPVALGVGNPSLATMVALAGMSTTLHDYPISDNRPRCPHGTSEYPDPVDAVVAAVHTYLPDFVLVDASRAVDLSGVCSLRVRERDANGSVLVASIDSPPNSGGTPVTLIANSGVSTIVDVVGFENNWRLEVLASGVTGEQPQTTDLENIVADSRLVW